MSSPDQSPVDEPSYRHVVVPLDGSDLAAGALGVARALAEHFGAELHTITVVDDEASADALRDEVAATTGPAVAGDKVQVRAGHDAAEAIAAFADGLGDSLLCMASHGRGRVAGALVGSVARTLLERTGAPVVVVGPSAIDSARGTALSPPRLVACVDGGSASESVVPVAAAWARRLGMSLSLLTVAEPVPAPMDDRPWHRHHGPNEDTDAYTRRLEQAWAGAAPAVDSVVVMDPIGPADGVAAHLRDDPAGLVALTTHARGGLPRVVFGADAAAIVQRSPAPVLVVPLRR